MLYGANPNHQDSNGATALHWAAAEGRNECIDVLIKKGKAIVDKKDNKGWPPIVYADFGANTQSIMTLLESNPGQLSILGSY